MRNQSTMACMHARKDRYIDILSRISRVREDRTGWAVDLLR